MLNRTNKGGYILELTPKIGKTFNGIEHGANTDFFYHQVYIKGKYVYDHMFGNKPVLTIDFLKTYQSMNPNGIKLMRQ